MKWYLYVLTAIFGLFALAMFTSDAQGASWAGGIFTASMVWVLKLARSLP